jgi:hypothetical protein
LELVIWNLVFGALKLESCDLLFGTWYLEFGTCYLELVIWNLVFGALKLESWNLELGIWSLVFGALKLESCDLLFGTWNLVFGTCYLELEIWNLKLVICDFPTTYFFIQTTCESMATLL